MKFFHKSIKLYCLFKTRYSKFEIRKWNVGTKVGDFGRAFSHKCLWWWSFWFCGRRRLYFLIPNLFFCSNGCPILFLNNLSSWYDKINDFQPIKMACAVCTFLRCVILLNNCLYLRVPTIYNNYNSHKIKIWNLKNK